jgi:hypothetical protein
LKDKKNQKTQKEGTRNIYYFFGSTMSFPWTKHIISFVRKKLGSSMKLGSFSHYIELCPPMFGYSSKTHGEIALPPASQNYVNVMLLGFDNL